ncbi:ribosomal protein, L45 [Nesidiocoris tenuis]|uniref:Large ribosomal subunit protein mL45 n=1 Tax=Nesidiocoris tenuis TaxID=355587 RepID=A0ABN7BDN5_9HEMI|nr:ribosomal protein, L45 [Nesidiocoris tenuis]
MFVCKTVGKLTCGRAPVSGPLSSSVGSVRTTIAKHYNPNFKKLRGQKFIKIDLPDYKELAGGSEGMSTEEMKSRLKERGLLPDRYWPERPFFILSTSMVFEPYVPPEGDGKVSIVTAQGAKQKLELVEKKGRSMLALRKIRNYEEDFSLKVFPDEAQEIYQKAHEAMVNKNRDDLPKYVTEKAYPEVLSNIGDKTIVWEFLGSIEPPRVVHIRCTDVVTKENIFAQITVRFHSQQRLAVYDRFGRLMHGDENLAKDVLEYVVFERPLAHKYGRWRIHDKIIPDWMPPKEPSLKTYVANDEIQDEPEPPSDVAVAPTSPPDKDERTPALATA